MQLEEGGRGEGQKVQLEEGEGRGTGSCEFNIGNILLL